MSVLDRKLRRDLVNARGMLLAILLVVTVGVACFVGMASAYAGLEHSRRVYYAACRMADFSVELKKAPRADVLRAADLPGVAEVHPRIAFEAVIELPNVSRPLNGRVISLPDRTRPVVNDIVLRRGTSFTGERLEEVIVNDAFARARRIHPGQTIHIILNNRRQALFVVGTAISSEFVYLLSPGSLIPEPENYGILYVPERFAEEALDFEGACNQVVGLLHEDARERPERLLDELERRLDAHGVFSTTPRSRQASHRFLSDEINGLRVTIGILPTIFLAVAALVLNILMLRLAEQQRATIGTLKALGYGDRTLTWHYLEFGMVVGVLGALLGIAAGWLLARGMIVIYRQYYEFPRLEARVTPTVLAVAAVISVAFSLLGTVRGVRALVRLEPAEAMRPRPPVRGGAIPLERLRGLWRRLGPRGQMAARSVWRSRWRTVVGMIAAALGSALMLIAFYFSDTMDYMIDFQFEKVLTSDVDVMFKDERDAAALLEARRLPAVTHAEPLLMVACELRRGHRTRRTAVTGLTRDARLTVPRRFDGAAVAVPATGLLMSRKLAAVLEVDVGETVTLVPIRGRREPTAVPVAALTDAFVGLATYADYGYLNRLVGEAGAISAVQLETGAGPAERRALFRALRRLPTAQAVIDNRETRDSLVRALLDTMKISMGALVGFAGALFLGSIVTTSLVTLAERRREVATFLVLGYERGQVGGIFLRETLLVNAVGAALGLPLGFCLIALLVRQYDTELYRMPLVLSPRSFVLAFLLSLVFTVLAHLLIRRAIARLDFQQALNASE